MTTPSAPPRPDAAPSEGAPSNLGRFLWHECLTSDIDAAHAFYAAVLGWGAQEFEGGETRYLMGTVEGVPTVGFMELPAGVRAAGGSPHWLTYIGTPDVDRTAREIESAGGSVHVRPRDIPGVGRFAVLTDPQGAYFAIHTPSQPVPESVGMAPVGDASWHELSTSDPKAAYDFYLEQFAWEPAGDMDMGNDGIYRMFGKNGLPLGGIFTPPQEGIPPNWLPYFRVRDLTKAVDAINKNGGSIVLDPMEVPGGDTIAVGTDPQGAAFAVHQTTVPQE